MANGFRGPVDFRTLLAEQGVLEAERGFGRMWSAGASEAVKAAYMRSAEVKGALAAENIRNRYYKKEFEQILDTRVKPLQERLSAAQAIRDQTVATTTMPVTRTVSPEEYQQRAESLGQGGQVQFQTVPGAAGKEGDQGKQVIPQQLPTPNPALDKQMGAIESEDVLAIVDPTSGSPVPINSPRGISIWQKAENDFWGEYSAVNKELMEIMAEYPGNPYANNYAQNLIDNVIKQGNIATTGKADPLKAQEWMEGRQQFDIEQAERQQLVQAGGFKLETAEAGLDVNVREAQQIVESDPSFIGLLGKTIMNKFDSGKPLTRREKFEAANAVRTYRELQEKELERQRKREAKEKVFKIPDIDVSNPENWQADMRADPGDPTYNQYYGEEYANFVNNQLTEVAQMPPEEQDALMSSFGASPDDVAMFQHGLGTISPGMRAAFERMANTKNAQVISNDLAMIRRLPELERRQPELAIIIDRQIQQAINQMKSEGRIPDEALLRADRYRTFFEITYGRPAPEIYDPRTLRRVAGILERRDLERLSEIVPEEVIEAPFEKTPEVVIEEQPLVVTEKPQQTIGAPTSIIGSRYERERLPGESETAFRFRVAREELGPLLEGIRTFIHKEPEKPSKKSATTSGRLRRKSKLKLMGLEE